MVIQNRLKRNFIAEKLFEIIISILYVFIFPPAPAVSLIMVDTAVLAPAVDHRPDLVATFLSRSCDCSGPLVSF